MPRGAIAVAARWIVLSDLKAAPSVGARMDTKIEGFVGLGAMVNLLLTIFGITDSTLHDELTLAGVLGGGSAFQGTIANNHIRFSIYITAS